MIDKQPTTLELERHLTTLIGELTDIPIEQIDVRAHFDRYGIDSAASVSITADLESHLGCIVEPTLLYDHPTIEKLAAHLSQG